MPARFGVRRDSAAFWRVNHESVSLFSPLQNIFPLAFIAANDIVTKYCLVLIHNAGGKNRERQTPQYPHARSLPKTPSNTEQYRVKNQTHRFSPIYPG
jgi:hypothetical protein